MKSAIIAAVFGLIGLLPAATPAQAAGAEDCAGKPSGAKLTVQVTGVRAAKGQVAVTVYPNDPNRFLAPHGKLARVRAIAQAPTTTACFWLPATGAYAVAVYHDENGNNTFDRSALGLPAEGFGFTNNPRTPTGLPPLSAVRFNTTGAETTVRIKLRYLS